jgi:hypothetical protein
MYVMRYEKQVRMGKWTAQMCDFLRLGISLVASGFADTVVLHAYLLVICITATS